MVTAALGSSDALDLNPAQKYTPPQEYNRAFRLPWMLLLFLLVSSALMCDARREKDNVEGESGSTEAVNDSTV